MIWCTLLWVLKLPCRCCWCGWCRSDNLFLFDGTTSRKAAGWPASRSFDVFHGIQNANFLLSRRNHIYFGGCNSFWVLKWYKFILIFSSKRVGKLLNWIKPLNYFDQLKQYLNEKKYTYVAADGGNYSTVLVKV